MRRRQTEAEIRLWFFLRDRRLCGYKFRRQVQIGRYIADLVCPQWKLIVELDGGHHSECAAYDQERSRFLARLGYEVIRFWNNDALQRTRLVLEAILMKLQEREDRARGS